jgi:hypothetical protein
VAAVKGAYLDASGTEGPAAAALVDTKASIGCPCCTTPPAQVHFDHVRKMSRSADASRQSQRSPGMENEVEARTGKLQTDARKAVSAELESLSKCPRFDKNFIVEVADVITHDSEICYTKAWTSGQPAL